MAMPPALPKPRKAFIITTVKRYFFLVEDSELPLSDIIPPIFPPCIFFIMSIMFMHMLMWFFMCPRFFERHQLPSAFLPDHSTVSPHPLTS